MGLVEQRLGLANLEDGTAVRFALVGQGPMVIFVPGWVSHLELGWAVPAEREFYEGLSTGRTLVRYDRPGADCPVAPTEPTWSISNSRCCNWSRPRSGRTAST